MQLLQVILLFPPASELSFQSTLLPMMEDVCTVLLLDAFYVVCEGCFGFGVNFFGVVESCVDYSKGAILPFIEIVTHISLHKPLYLHIDTLVFPYTNMIIN